MFSNQELLTQALTHISYANEKNCEHYERLEFLGDAVIELAVSEYIFSHFTIGSGNLSKLRASLVSTENLNNISNLLDLEKYILKSNSLTKISKKTNADLFESIIGAVFLDGGFEKAVGLIDKFVIVNIDNVNKHLDTCEDAKTKVQELLQKSGSTWEYKMIDSYGMDHDKTFVVTLLVDGKPVAEAKGKSLHLAENECAKLYLHNV